MPCKMNLCNSRNSYVIKIADMFTLDRQYCLALFIECVVKLLAQQIYNILNVEYR